MLIYGWSFWLCWWGAPAHYDPGNMMLKLLNQDHCDQQMKCFESCIYGNSYCHYDIYDKDHIFITEIDLFLLRLKICCVFILLTCNFWVVTSSIKLIKLKSNDLVVVLI